MQQPELGLKIVELRQQKGFTQEQLAECCDVSTRTIQRIESGEVEPRSFTRNNLSNVLGFDLGEDDTGHENFWLIIMHLSSIFCLVIVPLMVWSLKRRQSYQVDRQGRDVLNFQITMTILLFGCAAILLIIPFILLPFSGFGSSTDMETNLLLVTGSIVPLILIGFFTTYQGIKNAIRSLSGRPCYYPLSLKFVKE
jgi:uncharacterized Tic20 family protein